jgi:hypothetical protein
MDAVNNRWNQWVLGYNPARQRELVASLGFGDTGWQSLIALMAGGCAVVMGGLTLWALRRVSTTDAIDRSWLRLPPARRGRPPAPGLGRPLDYASRLAREAPEAAAGLPHRRRLRPAALRPGPRRCRPAEAIPPLLQEVPPR